MRVAAIVLVGALGLAGCTPDYVTQDQSDVIFQIVVVNNGDALASDVDVAGEVLADTATVDIAARFKNPRLLTPSVPNAVLVESYQVRYFRTDGRNVEGVDVPYRITGGLSTAVDVGTGAGSNQQVRLEVVRAQAKLEPPLRNLRNTTPTPFGGSAQVLTVMAEITIHGRTINDRAVDSTARLQIDFADYPD